MKQTIKDHFEIVQTATFQKALEKMSTKPWGKR